MRPLLYLVALLLFQGEEACTENVTFQFSGRIQPVDAFQVPPETNVVPQAYLNEISSLRLTNCSAVRLAVHGNRAFVLGHDIGHDLRVIDLSDPRHPRQVSRQTGPVLPADIEATSENVFVALSEWSAGQFRILENASTPRLLGSLNFATELTETEIAGSFAYIAWWLQPNWGGLHIVDISNSLAPRLVSTWTAPRGANYGLVVAHNVAYVASGRYVERVDVSNPAQPQLINSIPTPGYVNDVVVSGNYAYISVDTNGVQIVDLSSPALPRTVGAIRLGGPGALAVAGQYLLVVDYGRDLRLFDVTRPESPVLLDTLSRVAVVDVRVVGDTIYMLNFSEDYDERLLPLCRLTLLQLGSTARPRLFVPHVTVAEDSGAHQFPIRIEDPDTPLEALGIEVNSDSSLITPPRLVSKPGGSNVIAFRTRADRHGTAPFTIRVTEPDGRSVHKAFHLHVSPVDDQPPAIINLSSASFVKVAPGHFRVTAYHPGSANVTLQANGPRDVDGNRLSYMWFPETLENPWLPAISFERTLHRRLRLGTHYFRVELTDDTVNYSVARVRVDVIPFQPRLRIPHRSGLFNRR